VKYLPATQLMQSLAASFAGFTVVLYLPVPQSIQATSEAELYLPVAHATQAVTQLPVLGASVVLEYTLHVTRSWCVMCSASATLQAAR
jgi:hypothetical protein